MATLSQSDMDKVAMRHEALLKRSFWQSNRVPCIALLMIAYLCFSWWFFAIGKVFSTANWGIAGNYLAQWISYEIRPTLNIDRDGAITISYGRFDPIGPNPNPNWIETENQVITRQTSAASATPTPTPTPQAAPNAAPNAMGATSFNFMSAIPKPQGETQTDSTQATQNKTELAMTKAHVTLGRQAAFTLEADQLTLTRADETVTLTLDRQKDRVLANGPLPQWVEQRQIGGRALAYFGFAGWIEISSDRVRVHNRFIGWANFFFDIDSKFFGQSFGEIVTLITSGPRLDPKSSNLALALHDFLYNPSWQHLDVWSKLLQTIVMAFVGTVLATCAAFPLAFIAARNITRNRPLNQLTKRFFDFLRSVDMLIFALFFTRGFGPGPLAGISAIFFTDTGTLGKVYSEALENIDDKQREGVKSVGATPLAVQRFGVLPQVMPIFASQALYFWESNTRSATIIGAMGAGGIGLKLWETMLTNSNWANVCYMVLLILAVVYVFDTISNSLRSRLMGKHATDI